MITVESKTDVFYQDAEIGYMLNPQYTGKGIMSIATKMLCQEALKN